MVSFFLYNYCIFIGYLQKLISGFSNDVQSLKKQQLDIIYFIIIIILERH